MHSSKKHLIIMILCCLIPVAGLAAIRLFGIPVSTGVYLTLMMLCPISHILLIKYMMGGEGHRAGHYQQDTSAQSCHSEPAGEQTKTANRLPVSK